MLRIKPGSSGRATSTLSHYALSSPQIVFSEEKKKAIISPQNKVDVSTMMNVLKTELLGTGWNLVWLSCDEACYEKGLEEHTFSCQNWHFPKGIVFFFFCKRNIHPTLL